jgi:5-methylthioadenosine/S-adenosylhomocysteine deaminase
LLRCGPGARVFDALPSEARFLSAEFVADGTRLAIAEMLRAGVTCFADMGYHAAVAGEVARECGVRAVLGLLVFERATPWGANAAEHIRDGLAVHDRFRGDPLITTTFAAYAADELADATLTRIRRLADELDVRLRTPLHATAQEVAAAVAATGQRPLARLQRLGLATPALVAVHATQLEPEEIAVLAETGASVVHCPRTDLRRASGACPVAALKRSGVTVALGADVDLAPIAPWAELHTAALLGDFIARDPGAISAAAAIEIATIDGARALNLADEVGSLVPGKAADLTCVDLSSLSLQPNLDPLALLVYSAGPDQISDVWVAGEQLIAAGDYLKLDRDAIRATADQWNRRLRHD